MLPGVVCPRAVGLSATDNDVATMVRRVMRFIGIVRGRLTDSDPTRNRQAAEKHGQLTDSKIAQAIRSKVGKSRSIRSKLEVPGDFVEKVFNPDKENYGI